MGNLMSNSSILNEIGGWQGQYLKKDFLSFNKKELEDKAGNFVLIVDALNKGKEKPAFSIKFKIDLDNSNPKLKEGYQDEYILRLKIKSLAKKKWKVLI
jgi:hypothetical protein